MSTTKTAKTVGEEQLAKMSIKAQKERDAEDAMRAYRAEQAAVLERTQHLRALRLEREAKLAAAAARTPVEQAPSAKTQSAKTQSAKTQSAKTQSAKPEPVKKSKTVTSARRVRAR